MRTIRTLLASLTCLGLVAIGAAPAAAQQASAAPTITIQLPARPPLASVTLKPSSTAVVINDVVQQTCSSQPRCTQGMVPRIASLLDAARGAGVYVVYTTPTSGSPILPEVAPADSDPVLRGAGQDRFFGTDLDYLLKSHGVDTIILAGWRINGSVLYTAVGAGLHGYTVVVPDDTTSAAQDYDIAVGHYQLFTQLNANPTNKPLQPNAVTLSRTDMIAFQ